MIANRLTEAQIDTDEEIGGHSAVWAKRAQIEGCDVFIAAQPTEFTSQTLPNSLSSQSKHLVFPQEKLRANKPKAKAKKEDIHLVFEYVGGDVILGYKAPRSNRLYFVHDPNGGKFKQMESYHQLVAKSESRPYRHMFGGY